MIEKFLELRFFIEFGVALIWAIILYLLTLKYWTQNIELKSDYLKVPTNNTLIVLGLIVPILIALVSYLYTKNPEGTYSSLLATIILFFIVLIIAIWETFAILNIATKEDIVKINIPKNRQIISGMSFMYGFLILGLIYFAIFFLFEIESPPENTKSNNQISDFILLEKPHMEINQSREQIIKIWGEPLDYLDINKKKLKYKSKVSFVYLNLDENDKLCKILYLKKELGGIMDGTNFIDEINSSIGPDENPNDIVTMINLLAKERAKANERDIKNEDYKYSAGILCIIYPHKPFKYKKDIKSYRKRFIGIGTDINLQNLFTESMRSNLLKEQSIKDAVEKGINKLFK